MLPAPPLTDPDERITRIRFFTRKLRSRGAVQVNEQWRWQRVSREHGIEARPRQLAVATATSEPFSPDTHDLVVIPTQSLAISRDAIIGAVPPDHSRQPGVLFTEGPMQIAPTPFRHSRESALVTVFRRYLAHNGLALPGLSPHVGEAEEVEGRP